jgi:HSP20 family protein
MPFKPVSNRIWNGNKPDSNVTTTDNEVKVAIDPGVKKENIKVNAYDNSLEVTTTGTERKYHEVIEIPPDLYKWYS